MSVARSIKSRQIGSTLITITVNGTAVTPVAGGPDARFISSITDNGTGDYTITLAAGQAAQADLVPVGIVHSTADRSARVSAVTKNTIRVVCRSIIAAPAAADSDFTITFIHRSYATNL